MDPGFFLGDFAGYALGVPFVPAPAGRGGVVAGRLLAAAQSAEVEARLAELARLRTRQLVEQVAGRWADFQEAKRRSVEAAMYTLLLAEI